MKTELNRIVLASESPQRRAILQELGIPFDALPVDVDEVTLGTPEATVLENAEIKVLAALPLVPDGAFVVAADTILFARGAILGKPGDPATAREYLRALSGQAIQAWSGVAVACKGHPQGSLALENATVHIRELSESEMEWYVATEEPLTRAGAFGVSRYGEVFVDRIEGAYSCVAGLPKAGMLAALSRVACSVSLSLPSYLPRDVLGRRGQLSAFVVPV